MLFLSFSFLSFHPLSNVVLLYVLYYPVDVYGNIIGVVMIVKKFLMRYNYFFVKWLHLHWRGRSFVQKKYCCYCYYTLGTFSSFSTMKHLCKL